MPEAVPDRLGGAMAPRRDVHFFWLLDGSESMKGARIQALNFAVASAVPEMIKAAEGEWKANVLVRALRFASDVRWIVEKPMPISEFRWKDIDAKGETRMGEALSTVAGELGKIDARRRFFPPVIILVTDGYPTDNFEAGLERLLSTEIGQITIRIAVAIDVGPDAMECLRKFTGVDKILRAEDADSIAKQIVLASVAAIKISSSPSCSAGKILEETAKSTGDSWTWRRSQ
jgi:uncharacterized protein YegL